MDIRTIALCLTLATPAALAAEAAAPAPATTPAAAPASAPTALDPVEVTVEKRQENAFREVQRGMKRVRSAKAEDADKIVCLKQKPTGSNIPVINCATNRFWEKIRASSLANGLGSVGGAVAGGGGSSRKDDRVFTMSIKDYNAMEQRFGKLAEDAAKSP